MSNLFRIFRVVGWETNRGRACICGTLSAKNNLKKSVKIFGSLK